MCIITHTSICTFVETNLQMLFLLDLILKELYKVLFYSTKTPISLYKNSNFNGLSL